MDGARLDRAKRALRVGVEQVQSLDLVAEPLEAHRKAAQRHEHVHHRTAHRERAEILDDVDPLATRAAGSLAWWCRLTLDAREDEYPLGDRLRADEIPTFVAFALHELHGLAPGLAEAFVRVFPLVTG